MILECGQQFGHGPFSKVPSVDSEPSAIFITAIDTNPLAVDPLKVIVGDEASFEDGISVLSKLTQGKVFLCKADGASISAPKFENLEVAEFSGKHPAGNPGTHIHFLNPVGANNQVWSIGYQDVIAIGKLFVTGKLYTDRVISLAGPQVQNPRLLKTRIGADLEQLTAGELLEGENRIISGSVWGGAQASGAFGYLGRIHNQVTVLKEGRERPLLHYLTPGANRQSILPIYLSAFKNKLFNFTTSTNGSERAMVPIGQYEKVMPLDILPTQLLRALAVGDTDMAQKLGCLELDEEDLALCTYVCAGKYEYGPILRDCLNTIEKEG